MAVIDTIEADERQRREWQQPGIDRERRIDVAQAEVGEVCGHLNALHGRLVRLMAGVLADGLWQQSGIRSPEHWATWQLGVSSSTARRLVAAARRHPELPATMAALDAGELSLDQVTPIVDTAPAWADARVANLARYATVAQIRRIVRGYPHPSATGEMTTRDHMHERSNDAVGDDLDSDADGESVPGGHHDADGTAASGISSAGADPNRDDPGHAADLGDPNRDDPGHAANLGDATQATSDPAVEPTTPHDAHGPIDPHLAEGIDVADLDTSDPGRLTLTQQPDGSWRLWGRLDADHGHLLDAALREIADRAADAVGASGGGGGGRISRAAALVTLAGHHLDGLDPVRRSRYRVHYTVDEHHQLLDPHGITLPGWLRSLITCDADSSVTWQRHGTPIAHTRSSTNISAGTRRHAVRRDHGRCRHCGSPGHHLHHIRHREHGGSNEPSNLVLLCGPCHRLHHRGVITIRGNPDLDHDRPGALHVVDAATGRVLRPNALIRPPTGPPPDPSGTYRHPTGERLDPRWIDFDPPPIVTATRTTTSKEPTARTTPAAPAATTNTDTTSSDTTSGATTNSDTTSGDTTSGDTTNTATTKSNTTNTRTAA